MPMTFAYNHLDNTIALFKLERETIIKMLKTHKDYKHLGHMRPHV